jgi:hypothetical protein
LGAPCTAAILIIPNNRNSCWRTYCKNDVLLYAPNALRWRRYLLNTCNANCRLYKSGYVASFRDGVLLDEGLRLTTPHTADI